jgi:hypothetical protein
MTDIVNLRKCKISVIFMGVILCLCLVGPGALRIAYGQGSLVETVGTMEISQEVDNGANQATPKRAAGAAKPAQDANNVTQQPSRNPADMQRNQMPPQAPPPNSQQQVQAPPPVPVEAAPAAPVVTADTNVPDVNDFNAFKREIDRIDMDARGEDIQWLGKLDKKAELARTMNNVVVAELGFLLKVAADVNDTNTMDAIKLVLKKRQDRLNKLVTKLDNEAKEDKPQRERKPLKPAGMQQQGQPTAPAGSNNPIRRARSTVGAE